VDDLKLPVAFLSHAAKEITDSGFSGPKLVEVCCAYAVDFNIDIPHARYPFDAQNKRTALMENLRCFSGKQQYQIIRELCDRLDPSGTNPPLIRLKTQLFTQHPDFADTDRTCGLDPTLVSETRHWLSDFPDVRKLFDEALQKHTNGVFQRNTLDDLRLALETLVKQILGNGKALENQQPIVGQYIKERKGSPQLANMFQKLLEYYCCYQNTYIKHNDAVITSEIEFIFEITTSFMKHFIRLKAVIPTA
jgi:hypothetical protein